MFSALASNFPAGTLTGAPKIEAMKIINEIESSGRGPYGGAVGQFGFNGDCTFAIPIRSIFIKGNKGFIQTCGGIVHDSIPENELLEIERKLEQLRALENNMKIDVGYIDNCPLSVDTENDLTKIRKMMESNE